MPEDKKGKEPSSSLDAFFEPTEEEITKEKEHKYYPVDKDKVEELKDLPEEEAPVKEAEAKTEKPAKKIKLKKPKEEKAPGQSKTMIIILVVVLGVLILGAGGYFGGSFLYNKFLKKKSEVAKTITKPKPPEKIQKTKPAPPAPTAPTPSSAPTPVSSSEPGEKSGLLTPSGPIKPTQEIQPTQASPTTPTAEPAKPASSTKPTPMPTPAGPTKPAPTQPPAKPITPTTASTKTQPVAVIASLSPSPPSKGWSCQVGAYMLNESLEGPVNSLRSLGYNNLYYVDTTRTLKIYHLYLTGAFDQKTAESKKQSLEQIGFKPRLEQTGPQFRVIAYSYGSKSIAQSSKAKIEKAGLGPAEIIPKTGPVLLHQLRVGPYTNLADARQVLNKLRANNFKPVLVQEK